MDTTLVTHYKLTIIIKQNVLRFHVPTMDHMRSHEQNQSSLFIKDKFRNFRSRGQLSCTF